MQRKITKKNKQCSMVLNGVRCKNEAIREYCAFCDKELQEARNSTVRKRGRGRGHSSPRSHRLESEEEEQITNEWLKSEHESYLEHDDLSYYIESRRSRDIPEKDQYDDYITKLSEDLDGYDQAFAYYNYPPDDDGVDFGKLVNDYYRDDWSRYSDSAWKRSSNGEWVSESRNSKTVYVSERLEKGKYKLVQSIEHMKYYIMRSSVGDYYAVTISNCGYIPDRLIKKQKDLKVYQHYMRGPYRSFYEASGALFDGGETQYRITDRIKRVRNPEWLPPNLREAAYHGEWSIIPEHMKEKLIRWKKSGCPGWYKGNVIVQQTGNKKNEDSIDYC